VSDTVPNCFLSLQWAPPPSSLTSIPPFSFAAHDSVPSPEPTPSHSLQITGSLPRRGFCQLELSSRSVWFKARTQIPQGLERAIRSTSRSGIVTAGSDTLPSEDWGKDQVVCFKSIDP
jgi:hypothetical protein